MNTPRSLVAVHFFTGSTYAPGFLGIADIFFIHAFDPVNNDFRAVVNGGGAQFILQETVDELLALL